MIKAYWIMVLVLVELVFIVIFMPSNWVYTVNSKEVGMLDSLFNVTSMSRVNERTNRWYRNGIIDTGVDGAMWAFVEPAEGAREVVEHQAWNTYMEDRVRTIENFIYTVVRRLVVTASWLPFIALVGVPALIDGYLTWRIKRYGFAYTSPTIHRYAWRLKGVIVLGVLFLIVIPIPIAPQIIPSALALGAAGLALSISNMPKRY